MDKRLLVEQLRKKRTRLLKAYVLHVGWFTSTCASAATDAMDLTLVTSLWLTLITVAPVLIYTVIVHKATRAVDPGAPSVGLREVIITTVAFTPFESGILLPARNLWVSRGVLRAWDKAHALQLIRRINLCRSQQYKGGSMRKLLAGACGSVLFLLAGVASAADPIRAGYEVILTEGEDLWRVNTVVPLEAGQPLQQGLGPYVVSMTVTEDQGDNYTLQVAITGQPGSATQKTEFLRQSFKGNHKEQLAFSAAKDGLALKGVIFVGPPGVAKAK